MDLLNACSKSLLNAINNLNDVIAIQNAINIQKDKISFKEVLDSLVDSLIYDINKHEVQLEISIQEDASVMAPAAYLESIMLNLLTNAIKYRDTNRPLKIRVSYQTNEHYTIIKVKDNGMGIDLNRHKHKLFGMCQVFHKNEDARGLGLFIVKN